MSKVQQNRLSIQLAVECLKANGFANVHASRPQGTWPKAHVSANRDGTSYFIGVTCREETGADGNFNHCYNLVRTAGDLNEALRQADRQSAVPAFVAIALRGARGEYAAYFDTLQAISNPRCVPMLPGDRLRYHTLTNFTHDPRVADLSQF